MLDVVGWKRVKLKDGDTIFGLIRGAAQSPVPKSMWFFCNEHFVGKNGRRNFSIGDEVEIPVFLDPQCPITR